MFQLAFGAALEQRFGISPQYVNFTSIARLKRNWELGVFGIQPVSLSRLGRLSILSLTSAAHRLHRYGIDLSNMVLVDGGKIREMSDICYPPRIASGYWQCAELFADAHDAILDKFKFPPFGSDEGQWISRSKPCVAVHFRRGDYATDPLTAQTHLLCDPDWYRRAWDAMRDRLGECRAAVFSDDPNIARTDLHLDGDVVYVSDNLPRPSWVDMSRMSRCDHFIISNSSYSWWAAYLCSARDKLVIAPQFWFAGRKTADLGIAPSEWVLM